MTKEEFIEKARKIHGDHYDYSMVEYKNNKTNVTIKCNVCGLVFEQRAGNHINNNAGCPVCGREKAKKSMRDTQDDFIRKAKSVHGDKYDYSLVEYVKSTVPVKIKCKKCGGVFEQKPVMHIAGHGCNICNPQHNRLTNEQFVEKVKAKHPTIEVLTEYKGNNEKVTVRCTKHNHTFDTTPHRLAQMHGCKYCYYERSSDFRRNDPNEVYARINKEHNGKYILPNIEEEYKTNKSKLTVICPIHGEFRSTANKLLKGRGCPNCNESHDERHFSQLLDALGVKYERQKMFDWLGMHRLDFHITGTDLAFEIQGEFHFRSMTIKGKRVGANNQVVFDERKAGLCAENGIRIVYLVPHKWMKHTGISPIYRDDNVFEISADGSFGLDVSAMVAASKRI